ncbi:FixH family protein [Alkalimonas delamerensis]|uniref:FixH family protein n=1 Tax=Alkalimonas delamerensis TaxID=265981 RepID=A0ABT9GNT8_9GAMM|nr:FixH family protein [Alkalimonas delamerensis]MDP4528634.1 FixH family protein [Alkalimonas delamerensis]
MQLDTQPWYKQLWPWILILIPLVAFIRGGWAFHVMLQNQPEMVVDDYYREGRTINNRLELYREAALRNLEAHVLVIGNRAVVRFAENAVLDETLHLDFHHTTLGAHDFEVVAERSGELLYVATLPHTPSGRFRLVVSDDSKEWRLRVTLDVPTEQEVRLGY